MRYFREGTEIRYKGSHDLVSDADVEAEKLIVEVIRSTFPDHSFLGEEEHSDSVDAEHLWVIDPVDGTNNFAHGVPHFGISIGYVHNGVRTAGVVYHPALNELYAAARGEGATVNGEPARVSSVTTLKEALAVTGFYYDRGKTMEETLSTIRELFLRGVHGIRRYGAASLDLCYVGCGRFEVYFEYELKPWDFAAGALFVEEAGGAVTACTGKSLPLAHTSLIATNGALHDELVALVKEHVPHLTPLSE